MGFYRMGMDWYRSLEMKYPIARQRLKHFKNGSGRGLGRSGFEPLKA
jgi:hypothetical protein